MKSGFAIVVGKVIDMVPDNFTGRDGTDVKKLNVLVKPSDEGVPFECECWGETADKFEASEPILTQMIITAKVVGREWEYEGKTNRRTSLRIMEWVSLDGEEANTPTEQAGADMRF